MLAKHVFRRAHAGMPAVLLGTLFNVLDAVSTGLLVFPSDGTAFSGLQSKSMSIYIMSTLLSQVAMTLGGSLFPGALGAMLIEVLPFMRGVASDIRDALGDDSPSVIPTVMVAYALSSFLIGIVFLVIGALGLGRLVSYFPETVLTGAIGGIGVSLFILGLELPLPKGQTLTRSNAGTVLFGSDHVGLLMASALPIFFLCFSVRSTLLSRLTRGAVEHPYYVPLYILMIGAMFWIVVGGLGLSKLGGLSTLAEQGWLFSADNGSNSTQSPSLTEALNYWSLFDFRLVKISALKHAVTNFVLLVVIGVLNLPLYVPALALALDVPYSMNHELIGQGAANILAGACGTVPNILQLSYSVFFTRAGGKRIEAGMVIALIAVLYIVSSMLIRYIPTILASGLVLFLGIELTLEAVWESAKYLVWSEWLVVMATLFACTFLGFAAGVGVGIGAAFVVYTGWGCFDLRAKKLDCLDGRTMPVRRQHYRLLYQELGSQSNMRARYMRVPNSTSSIEEGAAHQDSESPEMDSDIKIVRLDGYVFFGVIPSIESALTNPASGNHPHQYIIVDMEPAYRVETAAARLVKTKARDNHATTLVVCGFDKVSGVAADLTRSGISLKFAGDTNTKCSDLPGEILAFQDCATAIEWCRLYRNRRKVLAASDALAEPVQNDKMKLARLRFLALFESHGLESQEIQESCSLSVSEDCQSLAHNETKVRVFEPTSATIPRPVLDSNAVHLLCVVSGTLRLASSTDIRTADHSRPVPARYNRDSLLHTITATARYVTQLAVRWTRRRHFGSVEPGTSHSSGLTVPDEFSDKASMAIAGDVICIPPPQGARSSTSEKASVLASSTKTPIAQPFKNWPEDCAEAVIETGNSNSSNGSGSSSNNRDSTNLDPCWLVEIVIPGDPSALLSSGSIERACQEAIRQAVLKLKAGD